MSTYQVRSLEEADQIIKEHERKTKTTYSLLRSTKNFGCVDIPACTNDENEVRFETVGVPYCGVPFFVAGLKILQCQSFKGRGQRKKKEIKIELTGSAAEVISETGNVHIRVDEEVKPFARKWKKTGRSNRLGCTATIIMKEVIYYPEFQLFEHSKSNRLAVARQLKETLKARTVVQKDRIIYVTVPAVSDHFGHSVGLNSSRKFYVKNDFYGHNEPGCSKRVYYPVKQEKNSSQISKRLKVEEDDCEIKAREIREVLSVIMGFTYKKNGVVTILNELLKDLNHAKYKYLQSTNLLPTSSETPQSSVVTIVAALGNENGEGSLVWQEARQSQPSVTAVVSPAPISSSPACIVSPPAVLQGSNENNNNQETSIFIEAMEAILNSQM